jgi:hypothetical protein
MGECLWEAGQEFSALLLPSSSEGEMNNGGLTLRKDELHSEIHSN